MIFLTFSVTNLTIYENMVIDMEFFDTPLPFMYSQKWLQISPLNLFEEALKISAWNSGLEFRLGILAWKISALNSDL